MRFLHDCETLDTSPTTFLQQEEDFTIQSSTLWFFIDFEYIPAERVPSRKLKPKSNLNSNLASHEITRIYQATTLSHLPFPPSIFTVKTRIPSTREQDTTRRVHTVDARIQREHEKTNTVRVFVLRTERPKDSRNRREGKGEKENERRANETRILEVTCAHAVNFFSTLDERNPPPPFGLVVSVRANGFAAEETWNLRERCSVAKEVVGYWDPL